MLVHQCLTSAITGHCPYFHWIHDSCDVHHLSCGHVGASPIFRPISYHNWWFVYFIISRIKKDGLYHIRWWVNTIKYLYIIFPCLLRPFSPHPPSGPCHSSDELGDQVPETRRPLLGRQQRSSKRVATCPSYEADLPSKGHGDLEWINWT